MGSSNWVHLDVEIILVETDSAFLVRLGEGEQHWLPFSQIESPGDYEEGDENCTISVTEWLARKKGLI